MSFKRGIGKKGQEGMTLTTLLAIIVGVVAVVLIVLFATGFFDKLNQGVEQTSELEVVVTACGVAGSAGLKADYCTLLRPVSIDGKAQYATCQLPSIGALISSEKRLSGCAPLTPDQKNDFCYNKKLKEGILVENTPCPPYVAKAAAPAAAK